MGIPKLTLDLKGLVTAPGNLANPPGSLTVAQNLDFPAPGLAVKRKGLETAANEFGGGCWATISTKQLGANLLFNIGAGSAATELQYTDGTVPYTSVTTPDATDVSNTPQARMKCAVALKNHFLTSSRAAGRLESDFSFYWAGMSRPRGFYVPNTTLAAGSFLANGSGVAYRMVIGTVDADGVTRLSPPSGRHVVSNIASTAGHTGAARGVTLRCLLPFQSDTTATAVTTAYFVQLYRSIQTVVATAQPNDELQLCYQANFTAGQITAGFVDITDNCPESVLGAYLYTNTVSGGDVSTGLVSPGGTGLGLGASNDRPPIAKDVASYADCLWWANFTTPQRQIVSILAVGAGGLAVGDVLNIGGVNFTGVAGAPASSVQFKVELALASTALNIRATAENFCAAVNAEATQTQVTATYIGSDATPGTIGQMLFETRRSDAVAFGLTTTGVTGAFLPDLANSSSTQDSWGNGLAVSKPFQGDAVPPANFLRVGRNDTVIQRVLSLRDALFIFTDDGIWWARGNSPADFVVDQFDPTFRVLARDAVVACGDAIYAWGYEGVARITSGGVEYLDLPIRPTVEDIQRGLEAAVGLEDFAHRAFAVAYRVQRRVVFFFPNGTETGNYACSRALVFHVSTGAWSTYLFDEDGDTTTNGKMGAVVRWTDELLHAGEWSNGTDTLLFRERSANTLNDYQDTDSSGSATIGIATIVQWDATVPQPAQLCHWQEAQIYFSPPTNESYSVPQTVDVLMATEMGLTSSVTLTPHVVQERVLASPDVAMSARMTLRLEHSLKADYFSIAGMGLIYLPISSFNVR